METSDRELAQHPFFEQMDPGLLKFFSACATRVTYSAGKQIYREGDRADHFLLIQQGNAAVELYCAGRGPLVIQTVADGEILGWSWLFPPFRRRFDARAVKNTTAFVLDGK